MQLIDILIARRDKLLAQVDELNTTIALVVEHGAASRIVPESAPASIPHEVSTDHRPEPAPPASIPHGVSTEYRAEPTPPALAVASQPLPEGVATMSPAHGTYEAAPLPPAPEQAPQADLPWEQPTQSAEESPKKGGRRTNAEIAGDLGVDLDAVKEWKGGGRITRGDIEEFAKLHKGAVAPAPAPSAGVSPEQHQADLEARARIQAERQDAYQGHDVAAPIPTQQFQAPIPQQQQPIQAPPAQFPPMQAPPQQFQAPVQQQQAWQPPYGGGFSEPMPVEPYQQG